MGKSNVINKYQLFYTKVSFLVSDYPKGQTEQESLAVLSFLECRGFFFGLVTEFVT